MARAAALLRRTHMKDRKGSASNTGVFVFNDFRDNLIVDRYCTHLSELSQRRPEKMEALRSENSEDAVTWNIFRSLLQIDPKHWLPLMFQRSFGKQLLNREMKNVRIELWTVLFPPPNLPWKEGDTEADIIIASDTFTWLIEAKFKSDISTDVKHNEYRNQIQRNIDVGSYHYSDADFYYSLLYLDEKYTPKGVRQTHLYTSNPTKIVQELSHRTDLLKNLRGVGLLRWSDIFEVLRDNHQIDEVERRYKEHLLDYLKERVLSAV